VGRIFFPAAESVAIVTFIGAYMPLVRISLMAGKPESYRQKISDVVHRAMVETVNVPAQDRFQIITEHSKSDFIYDAQYLNIPRTDDLVIIQITLNAGRTTELKKALYRRIADLLNQEAGIRKEDVFINLVEVTKENWSFGNGEAQYAT
jgi:phenylpyruvate tautomerase PptA (4-oxalocrotonate tautomerase family)